MAHPTRRAERRLILQRGGAFASTAALGLLAAACGFQPVYTRQRTDAGPMSPTADLYAINVVPIADREGQLLHNMLLDRLNPNGRPQQPLYQLATVLTVSVSNLGVLADATSSRARVRVTASSTLSGAGDPHQFRVEAVSSFNITESDYATVAAEDAAIERALQTIADKLSLRLAAFFRKARAQQG
ncbi:MAG: LPS assembly lipoprotein LptE [Marivibrio sp.]|uniref:LPS assembly lipoprotein LptE n=1 Tax=Marivibrio sp. TaxID=2039719 RepID=UPI0032EDC16E